MQRCDFNSNKVGLLFDNFKHPSFFAYSMQETVTCDLLGGHRDPDRMVVGFTTICAISAY